MAIGIVIGSLGEQTGIKRGGAGEAFFLGLRAVQKSAAWIFGGGKVECADAIWTILLHQAMGCGQGRFIGDFELGRKGASRDDLSGAGSERARMAWRDEFSFVNRGLNGVENGDRSAGWRSVRTALSDGESLGGGAGAMVARGHGRETTLGITI